MSAGELRGQIGEKHAMKNAMIRYLLNAASKKLPIKSNDIVKQCLRNEQKWFVQLLPEVKDTLADVSDFKLFRITFFRRIFPKIFFRFVFENRYMVC